MSSLFNKVTRFSREQRCTYICLYNQSQKKWKKKWEKLHANCELLVSCNRSFTCNDYFVISVQQLPSFQANLLVIGMVNVNHLSFASPSFASISSQQSLSSILVTSFWQKICSLCTSEDGGEVKREIIKQIPELKEKNKKTWSPIGWLVFNNDRPIALRTNTNSSRTSFAFN